jgi:hypothetical protein
MDLARCQQARASDLRKGLGGLIGPGPGVGNAAARVRARRGRRVSDIVGRNLLQPGRGSRMSRGGRVDPANETADRRGSRQEEPTDDR